MHDEWNPLFLQNPHQVCIFFSSRARLLINIFLENGQVSKLGLGEHVCKHIPLGTLSRKEEKRKLGDGLKGHEYAARGLSDMQQGIESNLKVLNRDPNIMRSNLPETLPREV